MNLLHDCGHHIANLIELDRRSTNDIINYIKNQKNLYNKLSELSEDNIEFILIKICEVVTESF
jgi:predicted regulator of amino acid metabolism with ACT domain